MKRIKNNHSRILRLAILKNLKTIIRYYPKMVYMCKHPKKYTREETYAYGMRIIDYFMKESNLAIEVHGKENIPDEKGLFVCANHQEKFDAIVLWKSFPQKLGVIVDGFAARRHFIREMCKLVNSIALLKNDMKSMMIAVNQLTEELKNKINYMIFPEGRYEDDCKHLLPFSGGSFKSPLRAKSIILPVALINSNHVFEKNMPKPYVIQVHYLKPIYPAEYEKMRSLEIATMVQNRIQEVVDKFQI